MKLLNYMAHDQTARFILHLVNCVGRCMYKLYNWSFHVVSHNVSDKNRKSWNFCFFLLRLEWYDCCVISVSFGNLENSMLPNWFEQWCYLLIMHCMPTKHQLSVIWLKYRRFYASAWCSYSERIYESSILWMKSIKCSWM